ncbi:MAG: hypothetical protein SF029_18840 [bacterium]|nr:hypothetical protein [bacterium]
MPLLIIPVVYPMCEQITDFENALQQLVGLECWNVMAGAVGSLASLDIGAKVPRDKPLPYPNVKLSPDEHKFRGEFVLYLEYCPWRLDSSDEVLASWNDSNAPRGRIVTGLKRLIGAKISGVELLRPGLDLTVRFDNDLTLRIFPDMTQRDEGDNYSLSVANEVTYIVGAHSELRIE